MRVQLDYAVATETQTQTVATRHSYIVSLKKENLTNKEQCLKSEKIV